MTEELEQENETNASDAAGTSNAAEEELHELSLPAVIDIEALLHPISGDQPSGEYMRYSGIYDEISEARRQDDDLGAEDWDVNLKTADYRKVIELAEATLQTETKDLQIAAWFAEALVMEHGFAGLRDSLKFIAGMEDKFWETLHPEIDEGDEEGRANALAWMDRETAFAIRKAAITEGAGFGLIGFEDSQRFDIPESLEGFDSDERKKYADMQAQVEKENRTTKADWDKAVAASNRAFYEELDVAIGECLAAYEKLISVTDEKFDPNQVPNLNAVRKSLDEIKSQTDKLLEQKRIEEPDPEKDFEDEAAAGAGSGENSGAAEGGAGGAANGYSVKGAISSRREALKRLSEIARFFSQTEPHSPVSHLVNRAVKWGEMPLDGWLQEVVKDQSVLEQIRETLGLNAAAEDSEASESSDDGW